MDRDLWHLDATAQASLVRSGDATAVELVEAALTRAEEAADLHAVTALLPERARRMAGETTGPFAGVPVLLTDAGRGRALSRQSVSDAWTAIRDAAETAAEWTGSFDALLLPILDVAPWKIEAREPNGLLGGLLCSLANFARQPSVAIPTVQDGLPVGVQLQGAAGSDEALLEILEVVRPVAPRSPFRI